MLGMIARPFPFTIVDAESSADEADFPLSNLGNNDYGRVGRITAAAPGTYEIEVDLGSNPPAIDVAALLWHNLSAGDKIRVRASSNSDVVGNTQYNSGLLDAITGATSRDEPAPAKFLLTMNAPITKRYWHIEITAVADPGDYIQASRLLLMKKASFAIGPQRAELGAVDLNQKLQLETGDDRSSEDSLLVRPMAALDIRYASESEMQSVLGQYTLSLGVSRPMLIVVDLTNPNLQDQIVFGRPERIMNLQSEIYDVWQFQAAVKSLGP